LSLKVTLRQIREAQGFPRLKEALITDFRLSSRLVASPDFQEGVRAAILDKDHAPQWRPRSLDEVTDEMVEACFAPLGEGEELELIDRWTLVE
jgi:enoyl-CoA hydratase